MLQEEPSTVKRWAEFLISIKEDDTQATKNYSTIWPAGGAKRSRTKTKTANTERLQIQTIELLVKKKTLF